MKKHKIRLLFRNGYAQDLECDNFEVTKYTDGKINRITWESANPDIMSIEVSELVAVFHLEAR